MQIRLRFLYGTPVGDRCSNQCILLNLTNEEALPYLCGLIIRFSKAVWSQYIKFNVC